MRSYLDQVFGRLKLPDPDKNIRAAIARYPLDAILDGMAIFEAKRIAGTIDPDTSARYALGIVQNLAAINEGELICVVLLRADGSTRRHARCAHGRTRTCCP